MDRRTFMRGAAASAVAASCPALLTGCAGLPYVAATPLDDAVRVSRLALTDMDYALVELPGAKAPAFLARHENDQWTAISLLCTHKACVVKPSGTELECPCHGSRFAFDGALLEGPASEPLPPIRLEQNEGFLTLYLDRQ